MVSGQQASRLLPVFCFGVKGMKKAATVFFWSAAILALCILLAILLVGRRAKTVDMDLIAENGGPNSPSAGAASEHGQPGGVEPNATMHSAAGTANLEAGESDASIVEMVEDEMARRNAMPLRGRPMAKSFAAQANEILDRFGTNATPRIRAAADQLMASNDSTLCALGALMHFRGNGNWLDRTTIDKLLSLGDPSAVLMALGWLQDNGFGASAQELLQTWKRNGFDASVVAELLVNSGLEPGAARYAISLLPSGLPREEARTILEQVAREAREASAVRLAAALYLRDTMPFDEYQQAIESMSRSSRKDTVPTPPPGATDNAGRPDPNRVDPGEQRAWQISIGRLASQVSGPVDAVSGPVRLTSDDVEVLFENRGYATLAVTALQLEYVLSHPDSLVGQGTSQRLREYLGPIREEELSEDDILCMRRIEASLQRLPAVERPDVKTVP